MQERNLNDLYIKRISTRSKIQYLFHKSVILLLLVPVLFGQTLLANQIAEKATQNEQVKQDASAQSQSKSDDKQSAEDEKKGKDITEQQLDKAIQEFKEITENNEFAVDGKRIANNFLTLANNSWSNVAYEAGEMVATTLLWSTIFGIGGFVAGIVVYLILLYTGWASFKWKYFWTVGWIIPVFFVFSFSSGFSYSGGFYGLRSYCNNAIEKDLLIERVSMTMYCAIMMEHADYELTGEEHVSELTSVFENPSEHQIDFDEDFRRLLKKQIGENKEDRGWFESMALDLGVEVIDGRIGEWVKENGIDIRMLAVALMDRKAAEEKFGKMTVKEGLATAAPLFKKGRSLAISWIDLFLMPNVYLGIITGVLIPIAALLLLHLIVRLIQWIVGMFSSNGDKQEPIEKEKAMLQ